jgi:hypothetical protein
MAPVLAAGPGLEKKVSAAHEAENLHTAEPGQKKDWYSAMLELGPGATDSWRSDLDGEILYILDGGGKLEIAGNREITLDRGTVARLASITDHVVTNTSRTRTLRILVVFALEKGRQHPLLTSEQRPVHRSGDPPSREHGRGTKMTHQDPPGVGLVF